MSKQTKVENSSSAQLFPTEAAKCERQSLIYMKKLLAVSVSNILYLRNVFNETSYVTRKFQNIKLRILCDDKTNDSVSAIIHWLKGCFDAIQMKYLRQLTIGLFKDINNPNEIFESYTFRFAYGDDTINISLNGGSSNNHRITINECDIQNDTRKLLRKLIILTESLDKLPEECHITMKLLYYDDITPHDYEPQGFGRALYDRFTYEGNPIHVKVGDVKTDFHKMTMQIKIDNSQFPDHHDHHDHTPVQCKSIENAKRNIEDCDEFDEIIMAHDKSVNKKTSKGTDVSINMTNNVEFGENGDSHRKKLRKTSDLKEAISITFTL